ncbi:unnamed protein product [Trichobilharzia szidati]|nr:unnamed protein product [Trichobilharzia szidati]
MSSATKEDLYGVSWSNPAWSHFLCSANVLDYFCDLSNPFYDRQCNNEVIRMQRLHPEQLLCMTGVEFYLHHAQMLLPCARYHPSDGSYSWDDPNVLLGCNTESDQAYSKPQSTLRAEKELSKPATLFQVQRTDALLAEWMNRFPAPSANFIQSVVNSGQTPSATTAVSSASGGSGVTPVPSAQTAIKEETPQASSNSPAKLPTKLPTLPGVSVVPGPPQNTSVQSSHPVDKKPRV